MTSALAGADSGATLTRLRQSTPLVHSITNYVAMNPAANVLLALGASPAMVHAAEEAAEFAALADALVINIGTLSAPWVDAMLSAAESAQQQQTPWVLDPVAIGATRFRRDACARLLEFSPTIIRGNASEIIALAGDALGGRGVDSTAASDEALTAAVALARRQQAVVAVTGEVDLVTDGQRCVRIAGGHALMPRVTALGCALSGVVAAFAACEKDPLLATACALTCYAEAGAQAGQTAPGPGSFAVAFIDALHQLSADALANRTPLEISTLP
ncbi:MAG: hydroxyethylthiazole kinase [Pseudomonadota bacterium]|nr:hydroxyethylthiazole kinase [Pseudomonadota bacterium]